MRLNIWVKFLKKNLSIFCYIIKDYLFSILNVLIESVKYDSSTRGFKKNKNFLMLNLQLKFNQHDTVLIKTIEFKSVGKYCNAIKSV